MILRLKEGDSFPVLDDEGKPAGTVTVDRICIGSKARSVEVDVRGVRPGKILKAVRVKPKEVSDG